MFEVSAVCINRYLILPAPSLVRPMRLNEIEKFTIQYEKLISV